MKRKALALTLALALLFSAVAGTQIVNLGRANPYLYEQEQGGVSPPYDIKPPEISIFSPKNNALYISNNISLNFNVSYVSPPLPQAFYYYNTLTEIYYEADWQQNKTIVYDSNILPPTGQTAIFSRNVSLNLTDIPEGRHNLEVYAIVKGSRETYRSGITILYGRYELIGSSVVNFTIASVSILSPQNKTYDTSDVPLLFKVHESSTQISYSLDGQDKVVVSGNTTLIDVPNGDHNVTFYAMDKAGNTGTSETIYFSIEPFPTNLVVAVSGASFVIIGVGLVVYFKKRKHVDAKQA